MADHGLKISPDGVDVNTAADEDLLFTTKHKTLKISNSRKDTIAAGATLSAAHGYSYRPVYLSFVNDGTGKWYPIAYGLVPVSVVTQVDTTYVATTNNEASSRDVRTIIAVDKIV